MTTNRLAPALAADRGQGPREAAGRPGPKRAARSGQPRLGGAGPAVRALAGPLAGAAAGLVLLAPVGGFLLVAVSPRTFGQGSAWFTLAPFGSALSGSMLRALLDTALTGAGAAVLAAAVGTALALLLGRTKVPGDGLWRVAIWALLLAPSYLEALGWTRLVEPDGVLTQLLGIDVGWLRHLVMGPLGVIWVLGSRGVPFAFFAVSGSVAGLGRDFEDAARVHGAGTRSRLRITLGMLAPGLWAAVAIVFAEAISDYGVAATLAADAHFPIATYALAGAVTNFPADYPTAAAVGWLLMVLIVLAMLAQRRATRGRSYAVLSGRTRFTARVPLSGRRSAAALGLGLFFLLALAVPALGVVSASMLGPFGTVTAHSFTLDNYRQVFQQSNLLEPLLLSLQLAAVTATAALIGAVLVARFLSRSARTGAGRAAGVLDLLLLGAVALPSIVLGAGYIFTYNLPLMNVLGIHLYGTLTLLAIGLLAGALPGASRMLAGSFAQVQDSMLAAARVHGAGPARTWATTVLPLLSRGLLWTWLLTFGDRFLELPLASMLYPPGRQPLSVAVTSLIVNYDFGTGTASLVIACAGVLLVIALVLLTFRLVAPSSWHRLEQR
ncbi:iron ABC transporter permease [Streptomyces sp. TP-A0356]|uniref:ABC transporter permease n=1 Tax=Streptomyces sp. TP-A0356 TaxID=1359208 RepID=UPI0006E31C8B|nr:iron ABC transporter permease [Streptomyces sp. TP-A0356]